MEDFVDPQMTIRVMQDFKNNMDSPEMERMRAIACVPKPLALRLHACRSTKQCGTRGKHSTALRPRLNRRSRIKNRLTGTCVLSTLLYRYFL